MKFTLEFNFDTTDERDEFLDIIAEHAPELTAFAQEEKDGEELLVLVHVPPSCGFTNTIAANDYVEGIYELNS